MTFLDRTLLALASCCLSAILIILFSGSVSSGYSSTSSENKETKEVSNTDTNKSDEMIVYSQEIDDVIEKYFKTLKENPAIDEEEKRLVEEEPNTEVLNNINTSQELRKISIKDDIKKIQHPSDKLYIEHVVQPGESLWRISTKYEVPLYTIISANPEKRKKVIHPGDRLKIPTEKGIHYSIKARDTLSGIARKYKIPLSSIKEKNKLVTSKIQKGQKLFLPNAKPIPTVRYKLVQRFIWPTRGRITSYYGWRRHPLSKKKDFHEGIDIGARSGAPIKAIARGVVIHARNSGGYGKLIILRHKSGYLSAYAHCSKLHVRKGQLVKKGSLIGRVGSSGNVTGSHLHFEMKLDNKNVNPVIALRKKVKVPIS